MVSSEINMRILLIMVLTLLISVFQPNMAQPIKVDIKSHKVLSKGIDANRVQDIYDDSDSSTGSFFSSKSQYVEVLFDLGKNYLIDHVEIKMKRDVKMHDVNISVGNALNDQMRLPYDCKMTTTSEGVYTCQPQCEMINTRRPGIIARKFVMKLLVPAKWISVYEMRVYSLPTLQSDDISSNRLVLPLACSGYPWLLTSKTSITKKPVATTTTTDIYFEKPYVVMEIDVQFENTSPTTLEISMMNGQKQNVSLVINLSDCMSQRSIFSCAISEKTFPSTRVRILTMGLTKISIRGKPAYYPKLSIKTSKNVKENLKMTCDYTPCDLSVFNDCSPEAIKSGVKFECANKQFLRLPSGSDQDSYLIANEGKLVPVWNRTKFTVDSSSDDRMIVSMPRSYQYFGQYKCVCIAGDKMNTEITSTATELKDADFLEDLMFKNEPQYKKSEEDSVFSKVSDNVLYLSKSVVGSSFIPMKVTMFSLVQGNSINITFPTNEIEMDHTFVERSQPFSIKAFETIGQSWSVAVHKYETDEFYPELIHQKVISIKSTSKSNNLNQIDIVTMLDEDKVQTKPTMWSHTDGKTLQVRIMYAGKDELKLYKNKTSCTGSSSKVLTTFTNNNCGSSDSKLSCSKFNNAILVVFTDAANFANEIDFNLVGSTNKISVGNITIKSHVVLSQNDVMLKYRYVGLTSKSKDVNVAQLKIDVVSRKVADFSPCGKVLVKIATDAKKQDMILQKYIDLDLEVTSVPTKVTIEISIVDVEGKHVSTLEIRDPTTFGVSDYKLQEDQELNLLWNGIEEIASDLLESYELTIVTHTLACNGTTTEVKTIPKLQTVGEHNKYRVRLAPVSKKHLVKLSVAIQPVFKGGKRGQINTLEKLFNKIGSSVLRIDDSIHTTERTVTVIPSQTGLLCAVKDVQFSVTGVNVEKFQWDTVSLGNMKYKIRNLVPGRTYQMTVRVVYENGPNDTVSTTYTFETSDDITILKTRHFAQINEKVNISCNVEIGPDDKFKKTLGWLRADKSVLPDGVKSIISSYNPRMVFLIMEKTLADYSGEYACIATPSAAAGAMKMTIVVNDLALSKTEELVDFSYKSGNVSVTCSSFAGGETKLTWIDPLGASIPAGDSAQYNVTNFVTDQKVYKSTLTVKSVSLVNSGTYNCHKSIGNVNATKSFLLYGNENIRIEALPPSSFFVGEKIKLRCTADAGLRTQKVMWQTVPSKDGDSTTVMKTSYPLESNQLVQDLEITGSLALPHVSCKLVPSLTEDKESLSMTYTIKFDSKIVVQGPTEATLGSDVKLTCLGYPTSPKMQLKWIFYPNNENTTAKVVKTSEDMSLLSQSAPIKLELNLTKVNVMEAGRYECKFREELTGGAMKLGKSITLAVNSLTNPSVVEKAQMTDEQDKAGKGALTTTFSTFLLAVIVVVSVCHRS